MIHLKDLDNYKEYIIKQRRHIHQYPETGFQEFKTVAHIKKELQSFGLDIIEEVARTGIIGILQNGSGKTVALRADIDALNMQEEFESDYKSKHDGIMHSCGHDTHTAMLLGAAKYLSEHKDLIQGTVKFIFQPAEEGPMPGGGALIVEEGHLKDVDAIFGLHITTRDESGQIVVKKGSAMAAPDEFKVTITGTGTHASAPQTGHDPIVAASQIISSLQTIVSRNIAATDSAVISVGTIHGGTAFNIIPETVTFTGTIRTLTQEVRHFVFQRFESLVQDLAKAYQVKADVELIPAYPPLINDKEMSDFVLDIAKQITDENNVIEAELPSMGGEDFSYYLQEIPGSYFWLGAKQPGETNAAYNHNPQFNPDENAFVLGTCMHINIVSEFLKK
jgi:amidohydrolase